MKKNNLFTAICLATCLLSCSSNSDEYINIIPSYNRDVTNINMRTDEGIIEGDASHQYLANILYHCIEESIAKKTDKDYLKKVFPDYYGGAYTDNEGLLTILIKGNLENGKKNILSHINYDEIIVFKECRFSYQELTDIIDQITTHFQFLPKRIQDNIDSYYLDDMSNNVVIRLLDIDNESVSFLKSIIKNTDAVIFIKKSKDNKAPLYSTKPPIFWEYIQPGSVVHCYSNSYQSYGSWAFRARDVNDVTKEGMVTACHVLSINNDSAFICSYFVGVSELPIYTSDADVAFVEIENNYPIICFIPDNTMSTDYQYGAYPSTWGANPSDELSTDLWDPIVGTIVNKRGWTTGLTTGTVQCSNYCQVVDLGYGQTRTIVNNTYASFTTMMGDSGGIVYTYFSNQNKRCTSGIISGMVFANNGSVCGGFFTKAYIALARLGVERY